MTYPWLCERADNMRTMSRATFALQPRQTVAALASARVPSASAGDANRPASESGVAASVRRPTVSAAPGAAAVAGRPPAASPPLSAATSGRPPAAANVPPLPAAGGAGGGSASPASSPPPPAHVVAAALVPELRPVKRVADIGPVVAPEKYDADLEGKSDYVKKTVGNNVRAPCFRRGSDWCSPALSRCGVISFSIRLPLRGL